MGSNLADRLAEQGHLVVLYDNLSRPGVDDNVAWLKRRHGSRVELVVGDTRDRPRLRAAMRGADRVFHFAAQVAVTSSLSDPVFDLQVNARGTLNVLEEARRLHDPPALLFASTGKVYGALGDLRLREGERRYELCDEHAQPGVDERRPLDFHSPYGCSKGAADQYFTDYARTFGLRTVVFRLGSVYGPRQFGSEDQGWVSHFLMRALAGDAIVIYGDGKQVRDLLYVDDVVDAMLHAHAGIEQLSGKAFNIGGGSANTLSLLELVALIGEVTGRTPSVTFAAWRPGDQRHYVTDGRTFASATGWAPRVDVRTGVTSLCTWILEHRISAPARRVVGMVAR
jgi:CDP-paratose 2-epimerase